MRVGLADDSILFREGLRLLLNAVDIDVAFETGDASSLVAMVDADVPDAVIVDIRMPPTFTDDGVIAARALKAKHPDLGVLVLSTHDETSFAVRLLDGGTRGVGYLSKNRVDDVAALVDALERVRSGRSVIDSDIVERLISQHSLVNDLGRLTDRERDVLQHMAEGRSNVGIGQALHLSARTVEAHVANIFSKLRIPAGGDDNRRVLAVLTWLRG